MSQCLQKETKHSKRIYVIFGYFRFLKQVNAVLRQFIPTRGIECFVSPTPVFRGSEQFSEFVSITIDQEDRFIPRIRISALVLLRFKWVKKREKERGGNKC